MSRSAQTGNKPAVTDATATPEAFARALAEARRRRYSSEIQLRSQLKIRAGQRVVAAKAHLSGKVSAEALPDDIATNWHAIGPMQTLTSPYGAITGRISSIALDPRDASGNTAYLGTTGGGVWKSTNAAGAATFAQISDNAIPSTLGIGSQSIGAVSVQPGGTGVILAGTGDPNDALDSYYGSGILRSANHGATWTTISQSSDAPPSSPVSFYGEGFSGFAWSGSNPNLVVAAVTQASDAAVVNAEQANSADGLYYSPDAGVTWLMATLTDGPGRIFQSPLTTNGAPHGNSATAVVWNAVRQQFYAAIRFHGYYSSPDGVTWTRLANQPGNNLSPGLCPARSPGAISCPIFRGALAVQPVSGDTFAMTVDKNLIDQGIWQDVCAANAGHCTTGATTNFATRIADTELEESSGAIAQGDYNLWLAAVPSNADTLLFVGTEDIWKRSLAATDVSWRNTTNVTTCFKAQAAPSQHAVAVGPNGLLFFGNDGGLWRTADAVNQQQMECTSDDAVHFHNLNNSLGSLAELSSVAPSPGSASVLLAGEGVDGSAGTSTSGGMWQQTLDGDGAFTAIDPVTPGNWFVTSGPGVSISFCGSGGGCLPAGFAIQPLVGGAQTGGDGQDLGEPAVWMLDPQDSSSMIVGTCRVWRGNIAGGVADWTGRNAISGMLDLNNQTRCSGNAQVKSLGGGGAFPAIQETLYAGMQGSLTGGGIVAGHVFTANVSATQSGAASWTDLYTSPVLNDSANGRQFNPGGFGVSSVVADSHDPSGATVYTTIQGFSGNGISEPLVYRSINQGQSWTNITANLPFAPLNALVVDPGNASIVYVATDAGVYMTTNVSSCGAGAEQCWSMYGIGLPDAPVTTLATNGVNGTLLVAGTYGRGAYEMLLASAGGQQTGGGTGTAAATDTLNVASLSFAVQAVGTASAVQSVTITNSGDVALTLITATSTSGDFLVNGSACSTNVPGHQTCAVSVIFAPQSPGPRTGSLVIADALHIGANAQTVSLLGAGAAPSGIVSLAPQSLDFGSEGQGSTSAPQSFILTNNGNVALSGLTFATAGNFGYSAGTCGSTLAVGQGCMVPVTFTPNATGVRLGSLSVYANELANGLTSALSGTGLDFTIMPTSNPTETIVTGTAANFGLTIAGVGASAGTIMLACTSVPALPAGSACMTSPVSLTIVSGVTGSATVSVTTPALTVSSLGKLEVQSLPKWLMLAIMAPLLGWRRRKAFRPWMSLLLCAALILAGGLAGCGSNASGGSTSGGGGSGSGGTGGGGGGSTATSTYVLTVTASAAGISRTTSLTLILEE